MFLESQLVEGLEGDPKNMAVLNIHIHETLKTP
jgi:hypothetical protein